MGREDEGILVVPLRGRNALSARKRTGRFLADGRNERENQRRGKRETGMIPSFEIQGKVVVVTGGGGVICGGQAKMCGELGAKVAVLDLFQEAAKSNARFYQVFDNNIDVYRRRTCIYSRWS